MQIWQPGYRVRDDGDYNVTVNPGNDSPFAIIDLSGDRNTALVIQSPQEADRLIKAAVKAKQLLDPPTATVSGYRLACGCTDWCNCDRCRAGQVHDTGSGWHCGTHGRTAVAGLPVAEPVAVTA